MSNPLEDLAAAIQAFVADTEDEAALVVGALVVWEQARYDDDGDQVRAIQYTVPGDAYSLAGSIGLAAAGLELVTADALDDDA